MIGNETPYKVSYKLTFKNKKYLSGNVFQEYDLSKYSDESMKIIRKENLCGKLDNITSEIHKYEYRYCKEEINDKKIIVNSSCDINIDKGEISINNVKKDFEDNGFKCTINK